MRAKPYKCTIIDGHERYRPCEASEATHVKLSCPGLFPYRLIPVRGKPSWEWNGDVERPTLSPSILTKNQMGVCHSFVRDGRIQFLNDCTHEYAGQTLDLLEVD